MLSITLRTIKDRLVSLISYAAGGLAFLWMYILIFPTVKSQAETYSQLLENFPEDLGKAFGLAELDFSTLESFLVAEQFGMIWAVIVMFMLVSWAGKNIAGEIEKGTFDLLLSSPVSRTRIFLGKYLSGILALVVFIVLSALIAIPLAEIHSVQYDATSYAVFAVLGFLLGVAVFSISSMLSAIFSEKGSVYKIAGSAFVIMYVLNIAALLKDSIEFLKYFSFFYYFDTGQLLLEQHISGVSIAVFLTVAAISLWVGLYTVNEKDIKT